MILELVSNNKKNTGYIDKCPRIVYYLLVI